MLTSINVSKKFVNKVALDNVTMTLEPGHIYALLGPNGSGKTTWMKMVAGLIKPTQGQIQFDNRPIDIASRNDIAYMSTEPFFYDWMTVKSVGKYYQDFFKDFSFEKYEALIKEMDLSMDLKIRTLSSGMMAKMKIAVTMARDVKVYMFDEPLNGIDLIARDEVINCILRTASPEKILIISSHLVEELESVVDKAIFIKYSKLVGIYDLEELRINEGVSIADKYREVYGKAREEAYNA